MKPTQIDLSIPGFDLEGNSLGTQTLGMLLANLLVGMMPGYEQHSIKIYQWGMQLHDNKTLSLDTEDLILFKRLVETSASLSVLGRAQILLRIKACEDAHSNPKA